MLTMSSKKAPSSTPLGSLLLLRYDLFKKHQNLIEYNKFFYWFILTLRLAFHHRSNPRLSGISLSDRRQISLLVMNKFKEINLIVFPLKSLEHRRFSDDFRGNRSSLIRLNLFNIRSEIWRRSLIEA